MIKILDKLDTAWRNLKQGVKNLIVWFPIIFKDRDFDSHYMYEILRFKIKLIERHIDEHKMHVGYERHVAEMHEACLLLDRLIEDNYFFQACKIDDIIFDSGDLRIETTEYFPFKDRDVHEYEMKMKRQDLERLGTILKKHSLNWWD